MLIEESVRIVNIADILKDSGSPNDGICRSRYKSGSLGYEDDSNLCEGKSSRPHTSTPT
jgi:hypothetical protein